MFKVEFKAIICFPLKVLQLNGLLANQFEFEIPIAFLKKLVF